MKIVVLDGYTLNPGDISWDGLRALGETKIYDRTGLGEIVHRAADAEAIYINKACIGPSEIDALPKLRFIGVLATGYNVVDIDYARKKGITVCNIPTYGTASVAQFVFALLLELCHHVGHHSNRVQGDAWAASQDFCFWDYPLIELHGKTLGIVGCGRIGMETAKLGAAFGMKLLGYDSRPVTTDLPGFAQVSFPELLSRSDVVSLHCPLSESNRGMLGEEALALMKPTAFLINTARGPLIQETALANALREGRLAGAGVDVLSTEPPSPDNPLLTAPNCIITPHIAWATKEARQRLMAMAVDNLASFLAGKPQNVVNSPLS